jgi:polar amino acid transport system substrate-binding protein
MSTVSHARKNEEVAMLGNLMMKGAVGALTLALSVAATASAGTLDEIKKRGEMVIGMEVAYVPYEFFKDGEVMGYDVDIARQFAEKLGVKVKFVDTEWNGIIPALLAKKFDAIISGMTITKERTEKVNFTMPYAEATNVVLVRADDDTIKSAEDIAGKRVGAQLASAGDKVATEFQEALKAKGKPGFTDYKLYDHYPEAYVDLTNKRIDAVVNSLSTLAVVIKEQPGKYKYVSGIQSIKAYFGMAFRKDDTDFVAFVNEQLGGMKKSGELAKLQEKWFGSTMETPDTIPEVLP